MKRVAFVVACIALTSVASVCVWADAAQITLSRSPNNSIQFTDTGSGYTATFTNNCGHANCIAGNALLDLGTSVFTGKYWMWMVRGPLQFTGGPSDFTVNQGTTDVWLQVWLGTNGSQGKFFADVVLSDMTGGQSSSVTFDGGFLTTQATGTFAPHYPLGDYGTMSLTVDLASRGGVAGLKSGQTTTARLSTGEIDAPVPEPASLGLLGSGVLAVAGLIRRKMK